MPNAIPSKPLARLGVGVALSAAAAFALSGCGAGQVTQTDQMVAAVPGTSYTVTGDPGVKISLRDAYIEFNKDGYAKDGTAPMSVRIFNSGTKAVELTEVQFPDEQATGVRLTEGPVELPSESAAGSESASDDAASDEASASDNASASDGASASDNASASDGASASEQPADDTKLALKLPVNGKLLLNPGEEQFLELTGLAEELNAGSVVHMTFVFGDAGEAPMDIPVAPPADADDAPRETPKDHGEGH